MKERKDVIWGVLLVVCILFFANFSRAAENMNPLRKCAKEIGFGTGYGWSVKSNRNVGNVPFNFRYGLILTDQKGPSFLKGNWEILVEGTLNYLFHNQEKYGIGVNGLIRYNFNQGGCIVPFVQAGVGVWHTNLKMHHFPNDFNFCSQLGPGIQFFIKKNLAIQCEYRFQHFSNASLYDDNAGLNLSNFLVGCAYFF